MSRRTARLAEAALVVAIAAAAAWWGTRYWYASLAAGNEPIFYQEYFEPAVNVACGRSFGVAVGPIPVSLDRFVNRKSDTFSCGDLPARAELSDRGLHQKSMRYLMLAVVATWKLTGRISWSGLGPMCGVLFAASTVAAYGILRLGMGWWIALLGTAAFATSTFHLQNAPHLRDYAKVPFALAAIWLCGLLVKRRPAPAVVCAIALAAGVVLGVGYGFRSDLFIYIPLFLLLLFACLEGGIRQHLRVKLGAAGLFLAAFVLAAWPILSAISNDGGCEWHVVLLGFATPFDGDMRMEPGPYQIGYTYLDGFVYHSVSGFAGRRDPSVDMTSCTPEYDGASRRYFLEIVKTMPADMLARAYASVRNMWDLPFRFEGPPLRGWFPTLYRARAKALMEIDWAQPAVIVIALIALAAHNLRWAAAAAVLLLYLGGYPALQSSPRHYFHLEFMTWWAFGWLASALATLAAIWWRSGVRAMRDRAMPDWRRSARDVAIFAAALVVLLAAPLTASRWYQQREMRGLFSRYVGAPKIDLAMRDAPAGVVRSLRIQPTPGFPRAPVAQSAMIEVDVDAASCPAPFDLSFVYAPKSSGGDFSWSLPIPAPRGPGLTRAFFPVYEGFDGLRVPDAAAGCLRGVSQFADVRPFPLLLAAVLAPGWEDRPLYQRIRYP